MIGSDLSRQGPSDLALNRLAGSFAIALRLGSAAAVAIAGPLAAVHGVSGSWLSVVIVALGVWSLAFAAVVWRYGARPFVVLVDAAVIALVITAHRHVVPLSAISDGTTWMLLVASTAIFIPQLTLWPALSLPVAAAVTVVYAVTVPHPTDASFLPVQALVTATVMTLVRRGGRSADAVIASDLHAEREIQAEAARRADEKQQYRRVHDTILSTLTMVASGAFGAQQPMLSAQAARDLQVLRGLPQMPAAPAPGAPLAERLRQVADEAAPLQVTLDLAVADVPPAVTEQIAGCVAEALSNVARHAGVGQADVNARAEGDCLVVEVIDRGRGFDPHSVPWSRRGVRESIRGRMAEAGGTAMLTSIPGQGTTIVLRWPA